jgi:hypothetical protein
VAELCSLALTESLWYSFLSSPEAAHQAVVDLGTNVSTVCEDLKSGFKMNRIRPVKSSSALYKTKTWCSLNLSSRQPIR